MKWILFVLSLLYTSVAIPLDLGECEQFIKNNTVTIYNGRSRNGSGFVTTYRGHNIVVTNAHVCQEHRDSKDYFENLYLENKRDLGIRLFRSIVYNAEIVKLDKYNDLCIIKPKSWDGKTAISSIQGFEVVRQKNIKATTLIVSTRMGKKDDNSLETHPLKYSKLDREKGKKHRDSHYLKGYVRTGMSGSPILNSEYKVVMVIWGMAWTSKLDKNGNPEPSPNWSNTPLAVGNSALIKFLELKK